jgi:hypothetical protein
MKPPGMSGFGKPSTRIVPERTFGGMKLEHKKVWNGSGPIEVALNHGGLEPANLHMMNDAGNGHYSRGGMPSTNGSYTIST